MRSRGTSEGVCGGLARPHINRIGLNRLLSCGYGDCAGAAVSWVGDEACGMAGAEGGEVPWWREQAQTCRSRAATLARKLRLSSFLMCVGQAWLFRRPV